MMPFYFFSVQATPDAKVELPDAKVELKEVAAPDFIRAVQALAAWRPGISILKLEGVWTDRPAYA
jgi:hypothetical protein